MYASTQKGMKDSFVFHIQMDMSSKTYIANANKINGSVMKTIGRSTFNSCANKRSNIVLSYVEIISCVKLV